MKIKMLKNVAVAHDHIHPVNFLAGHEYMVGDQVHEFSVYPAVAQGLLDDGSAEIADGKISDEQVAEQRKYHASPASRHIEVPIILPKPSDEEKQQAEEKARRHVDVAALLAKEPSALEQQQEAEQEHPLTKDEEVQQYMLEQRAADIQAHDGHTPVSDGGGENHPSVQEIDAHKIKADAKHKKS